MKEDLKTFCERVLPHFGSINVPSVFVVSFITNRKRYKEIEKCLKGYKSIWISDLEYTLPEGIYRIAISSRRDMKESKIESKKAEKKLGIKFSF